MKKRYSFVLLFFCFTALFAQNDETNKIKPLDSLYREDQFYFTLTYNNLQNNPQNLDQKKLSSGMCFGFLRDMPVSKKRNKAIALGLGYCFNQYNFNLVSKQTGTGTTYLVTTDLYDKSKLAQHFIEAPLEFRWRSSTPDTHKFWRIYTGFKVGYLVYDNYTYKSSLESFKVKSNPDFNKIQYGAYLATGWNTFNFYAYYGLSKLYKNAAINDKKINTNTINIGLQFYIL